MVNSDITVVRSLLDKGIFLKYFGTINGISNLPKQVKVLLSTIKSYYGAYKTAEGLTMEELQAYFYVENPMHKESETYKDLFASMAAVKLDNAELLSDIMQEVAKKHYMTQLAVLLEQYLADSKTLDIDDVEAIVSKFKDTIVSVDEVEHEVCNLSLSELLEQTEGDGLLWRSSNFLDSRLGLIKNRTLGHVFARPDVGKTAFAVFHAPYFAWQLKEAGKGPVLYCNNEEAIEKVKLRAYCSSLGMTSEQLKTDMMSAQGLWDNKHGYHLKFVGGVNHIDKLEALIKHFEPGMVIIDQGPKVYLPTRETEVKKLQLLYNRYREMAKQYDTRIMCLGQADALSEGKQKLTKNNLDNSKVGIPGECDWMLGIGMSLDEGLEEMRCINICKNKLTGLAGYQYYQFNTAKCLFKEEGI